MDQLIANVNTLVEYISFLEIYTNAGFFFSLKQYPWLCLIKKATNCNEYTAISVLSAKSLISGLTDNYYIDQLSSYKLRLEYWKSGSELIDEKRKKERKMLSYQSSFRQY